MLAIHQPIAWVVGMAPPAFSNWAVPGLYFFDNTAVEKSLSLNPSQRNEIEILDILKLYHTELELKIEKISRGNAWFDLGTPDSLLMASQFVKIVQERQGMLIGSPEEASFNANLLDKKNLETYLNSLENNRYFEMVINAIDKR